VTIGDASSLSLELLSSSVRANAEYQHTLAKIDHLKKENSKLKENIKSLNESNAYYHHKSRHGESGADALNEPLAKQVCMDKQEALEKVRNKFHQMNIAKYGKHFANGLWSYLGDTLH
jgi:predicted nuclease with TOPRIM domain